MSCVVDYGDYRIIEDTGLDVPEPDIFDECECLRCGRAKFPWQDLCTRCEEDMRQYDRIGRIPWAMYSEEMETITPKDILVL